MSDKLLIPEGMLEAAYRAWSLDRKTTIEQQCRIIIEAALLWQGKNAPVPTCDQFNELSKSNSGHSWMFLLGEWIRHMYDALEPEVPEEIKDLVLPKGSHHWRSMNNLMAECFRRGQQSKPRGSLE